MDISTKRWNDPLEPGNGTRILICRYRPRGLPKGEETWNVWKPELGPSKELLADYHGKGRLQTGWAEYRSRYLKEMLRQKDAMQKLSDQVLNGQFITLLCSAACEREARCHRSLLKSLIERAIEASKLAYEHGHKPS